MPSRFRVAQFALCVLIAGCSGSGGTGPNSPPGNPARLALQLGNNQTGTVGQQLTSPLKARVEDANQQPVPNTTVSWVVTKGGGSVFAPATQTGSDGNTQNLWTLGDSAGDQAVEVRWMDPATGDANVIGTFSAVADPGAAVTFRVATDTILTLDVGDTSRVLLEGHDQYGNAIAAGGVDASWTSADPAVARVDSAGRVSALASGATKLRALTSSDSAEVQVRVNALATTVTKDSSIAGLVYDFHKAGGRFLAFGLAVSSDGTQSAAVFAYDSAGWSPEFSRNSSGFSTGWVFPDGSAWTAEPSTGNPDTTRIWRSATSGSWSLVPNSPQIGGGVITGFGSGFIAYLATAAVGTTVMPDPEVWTWSAGAWTDLGSPPARGDSVWQSVSIAVRSLSEIYVGGILQQRYGSGRGRAVLAYWDGSQWAYPTLPAAATAGTSNVVRWLAADPSGGPVYGSITVEPGYSATDAYGVLFKVQGGTVTVVPNPLSSAGSQIKGVRVGASGAVYLTGTDQIVWESGSGWSHFYVPTGWFLLGPLWVDQDGTMWAWADPYSPFEHLAVFRISQ